MTIKVLAFAALAEQLGVGELTLDLSEPATVGDALDQLSERYPAIGGIRRQLATAVDMTYVDASHLLADGDELALISPVSGG